MSKPTLITVDHLTPLQRQIVQTPPKGKLFLEGPTGSGKTTVGVHRLRHLLDLGIPADRILILTPQRTLALPYADTLRRPALTPGGQANLATPAALARRMVDLFWPLVAEKAGFAHPDERPIFLTQETAQYHMARIVAPLLEAGYFETVTISRHRLYTQILDVMSKAAVVGFPLTEIATRLKEAWVGDPAQRTIYDQAQTCALHFRRYCLEHNLLDFSLQFDLFIKHLWPEPLCRAHLLRAYDHLIVDNVEELYPVAHDLLREWLPHAASALLILDRDAGYRIFLGADPEGAHALANLCDEHTTFTQLHTSGKNLIAFGQKLAHAIVPDTSAPSRLGEARPAPDAWPAIHVGHHRYHPQMLDWVADEVAALVHDEGLPPREIVILAPFLSEALRFSLLHRLAQRDIPARSHRPSRALRDEPATRTFLTWAALAHPRWQLCPPSHEVTYALMQSLTSLDLVRAHLMTDLLYRIEENRPTLRPFDTIRPEAQQRITYLLGGRYEALRTWLQTYSMRRRVALDHFLARLFGELLSQPGFGFHRDADAAQVVATLIESVRKFRQIARSLEAGTTAGQEYLRMVREGVIAAQYLRAWREENDDTVLLAPAYTFLMRNRPVEVQFWLDVGGTGWWERVYQPLTHPYVLSRRWPRGKPWTDADEYAARQEALRRLILGLIRRCRRRLYLGLSELGEQGFEQRGPLLRALQRALRAFNREYPEPHQREG